MVFASRRMLSIDSWMSGSGRQTIQRDPGTPGSGTASQALPLETNQNGAGRSAPVTLVAALIEAGSGSGGIERGRRN